MPQPCSSCQQKDLLRVQLNSPLLLWYPGLTLAGTYTHSTHPDYSAHTSFFSWVLPSPPSPLPLTSITFASALPSPSGLNLPPQGRAYCTFSALLPQQNSVNPPRPHHRKQSIQHTGTPSKAGDAGSRTETVIYSVRLSKQPCLSMALPIPKDPQCFPNLRAWARSAQRLESAAGPDICSLHPISSCWKRCTNYLSCSFDEPSTAAAPNNP